MKKLMFAAIAVAIATVSQAASISWKFTNQNPSDFASQYVYAVSASDYDAAINDLKTNDGAKFLSDYNIANTDAGTDYQLKLNARGGGAGATALKGTDNQLAFFIFKDGIVDGKTYYTSGLVGGASYLYTPPDQATSTIDLGTSASKFTTTGTIASSGGGTDPLPEPTSGLLLLVGGAVLALRRKQK